MFFPSCKLENSQTKALPGAFLHPCMYVSFHGALRKHWDRDLRKCAQTAAKCTGFTLLVAPGRAAQVVCGVGLKAKSALLLGPALEPARCWSLSCRAPELQTLCWLSHWRSQLRIHGRFCLSWGQATVELLLIRNGSKQPSVLRRSGPRRGFCRLALGVAGTWNFHSHDLEACALSAFLEGSPAHMLANSWDQDQEEERYRHKSNCFKKPDHANSWIVV